MSIAEADVAVDVVFPVSDTWDVSRVDVVSVGAEMNGMVVVSRVSVVLAVVLEVSKGIDGVDVVWISLHSVCNILPVVGTSG